MANEVRIKVAVDDRESRKLDDVGRRAKGAERSFMGMNASMVRTGLALGGIGLGAAGATRAMQGMISAASNLEEAQNKVNVVFGQSAAEVSAFADAASSSIGLSERAALEAAGAFGNMFNTIGLAADESARMSTSMVQLAADMASFNNQDPSAMLQRLQSGLAGEAEPLRRFGVLLSAARVEQEALTLGLTDGTRALTEQEKVAARYSIILRDTAVQQGDFARTSDGLANETRTLAAEWEELNATLGEFASPLAAQVVGGLANITAGVNDLIPRVHDLGFEFAGLNFRLGEFAGAAGNLAARGGIGLFGGPVGIAAQTAHAFGVPNPFTGGGGPGGPRNAASTAPGFGEPAIRPDLFAEGLAPLSARQRQLLEQATSRFEDLTGSMSEYEVGLVRLADETAAAGVSLRGVNEALGEDGLLKKLSEQTAMADTLRKAHEAQEQAIQAELTARRNLTEFLDPGAAVLAGASAQDAQDIANAMREAFMAGGGNFTPEERAQLGLPIILEVDGEQFATAVRNAEERLDQTGRR